MHVDFCSECPCFGDSGFEPFREALHGPTEISPRVAARDGPGGVPAADGLSVPRRAGRPDVHKQDMGAEDGRAPVGVLLARGLLRPAVGAREENPELLDDLGVGAVRHRPPFKQGLALDEPAPDGVHEVIEAAVAGLAHDVDIGPQNPQREVATGALYDLRRGREAFLFHGVLLGFAGFGDGACPLDSVVVHNTIFGVFD